MNTSIQNALSAASYKTVGDIVNAGRMGLLRINHFGRSSLMVIEDFLEECGIEFDNYGSAETKRDSIDWEQRTFEVAKVLFKLYLVKERTVGYSVCEAIQNAKYFIDEYKKEDL